MIGACKYQNIQNLDQACIQIIFIAFLVYLTHGAYLIQNYVAPYLLLHDHSVWSSHLKTPLLNAGLGVFCLVIFIGQALGA